MKQKTLLLLQLLLAVYALYSVVTYKDNLKLLIPLFCLIGMFVVSRIEGKVTQRKAKEPLQSEEGKGEATVRKPFNPIESLLKSKSALVLTDAVHCLLRDLGLEVARPPEHSILDRVLRIPGNEAGFGLKIFSNVEELSPQWDRWNEITALDVAQGGDLRLLIVSGNSVLGPDGSRPRFVNFPEDIQSFLKEQKIVALTTLTLFKIHHLCKENKLDPAAIFRLVHGHPGGVFQLEDYAKRPSDTAA
jgi:hypothetical protein